jgi:hypothetical protein
MLALQHTFAVLGMTVSDSAVVWPGAGPVAAVGGTIESIGSARVTVAIVGVILCTRGIGTAEKRAVFGAGTIAARLLP